MKQLMEAELMFDNPEARDRAIVELSKLGLEVELLLDQVDEYEGVVLTPTVWIRVTGPYEGSDDEFFRETWPGGSAATWRRRGCNFRHPTASTEMRASPIDGGTNE